MIDPNATFYKFYIEHYLEVYDNTKKELETKENSELETIINEFTTKDKILNILKLSIGYLDDNYIKYSVAKEILEFRNSKV